MASMLDTLLTQLVSAGGAEALGKTTQADTGKVESLLSAAVPMLVGAMANNASSEKGAASLASALDDHAGKKGSAKDLTSLLTGADTDDGAKILNHILGSETATEKETKKLAKKSGLSTSQVITILCAVAPLLLKVLGVTKQKTNTSSSDLSSLLSLFLGGASASSKKEDTTAELLGSLLSAATGTSSSKKQDSTADLLGALLSGGSSSSSDGADLLGSLLTGLLK